MEAKTKKMEQEIKSSEEEFAVVECTGSDEYGTFAPEKIHIERILEPHLLKSGGQKVVYFARIEGVSTLVGIRGHKSAPTRIDKAISDLCKFPRKKWEEFDENKELEYANLYLGRGVNIIALMDSAEQDASIFVNFVAQRQLDGLISKINKTTKEFKNFGEKFQSF